MLSCEEITLLLSRRLDEELSDAEAAMLDEHLTACLDCCALSESLTCLQEDLQLLSHEPPADLSDRIMAAIRLDSSSPADVTALPVAVAVKKRPTWRQWTSIAAALAVIILGTTGLVLLSPSSGSTPMDTIAYETAAAPEAAEEMGEVKASTSKSDDTVDAAAPPVDEGDAAEGSASDSTIRDAIQRADSEYGADEEPDLQIACAGEPLTIDTTNAVVSVIDEEAALYILRAYLALDTVDSLSCVGLSEDGLHYLFNHVSDEAAVSVYLISILDGSVSIPLP